MVDGAITKGYNSSHFVWLESVPQPMRYDHWYVIIALLVITMKDLMEWCSDFPCPSTLHPLIIYCRISPQTTTYTIFTLTYPLLIMSMDSNVS